MTANELWLRFCEERGIDPETSHSEWSFGGDPDGLAALVLRGVKTATASAAALYELDPDEPLPKAGDLSVVLNGSDEAVCVIRTARTYTVPFNEVSAEHAFKEGEGDRSLAYWRRVHEEFFRGEYEQYGLTFTEALPVLCEEFELLYPVKEAQA